MFSLLSVFKILTYRRMTRLFYSSESSYLNFLIATTILFRCTKLGRLFIFSFEHDSILPFADCLQYFVFIHITKYIYTYHRTASILFNENRISTKNGKFTVNSKD